MFGIRRNGTQGLCRGLEQEVIEDAFVLIGQGRNRLWDREDDVKVGRREQFRPPRLQPLGAGQGLTFGTMPVATRVVGNTMMVTPVTGFDMAAQGGRATAL